MHPRHDRVYSVAATPLVGRRFHSSSSPWLTRTVPPILTTELFMPAPVHRSHPFHFIVPGIG